MLVLINLRYELFKDIFNYEKNEEEFKINVFVFRLGLIYEIINSISVYVMYLEGF